MTPEQVQATQASNARYIVGAVEYAAILRRCTELHLIADALLHHGDQTAYAFIEMACNRLEATTRNLSKDEGFIQDCYDMSVDVLLGEKPDIDKARKLNERIVKMFPFITISPEQP